MTKLNDLWEQAIEKTGPVRNKNAKRTLKKASTEDKQQLVARAIPFTVTDLYTRGRGKETWWHAIIEVKGDSDGLQSPNLRLEFLDDTRRSLVFNQLKKLLPYEPAILVVDNEYQMIVDAPPKTRGEENLAQKANEAGSSS